MGKFTQEELEEIAKETRGNDISLSRWHRILKHLLINSMCFILATEK